MERGWENANGWGKGEPEGRRLMQCYRMREGGMLLSYRPCTTDESEANVTGKLDIRSESRERAFDHHDMLDTWMPGVVVIGIFYIYFTPIQAVTDVEGQTNCYSIRHFILSYKIKYSAGGLSCVPSKSQQLWLFHSALDRGEPCSDELLAPWLFQGQQILSKTRVGLNRDQRHSWMFSIL